MNQSFIFSKRTGCYSIGRRQTEAVRASLKEWMTLAISVPVEEWMVPVIIGKGGKEIRQLSQRIGGISLTVSRGVGFVTGRAASAKDAALATKIVQERVRNKKTDMRRPLPLLLK